MGPRRRRRSPSSTSTLTSTLTLNPSLTRTLTLNPTYPQPYPNPNPNQAVPEKKCDSEREEWCDGAGDGDNDLPEGADPINCVAVNKGVVEDQWCANPSPSPNPTLILTLTLTPSLPFGPHLDPPLTLPPFTLPPCTAVLPFILPPTPTPTLTPTPTRCVINCGFTPPNCLKDLCRCPIAGEASDNNVTSGNGTKGAEGEEAAEEDAGMSDFALAFERGRKEMAKEMGTEDKTTTKKKASSNTTTKKTTKAKKHDEEEEEQKQEEQEDVDEDEDEDEEGEKPKKKAEKPKKTDEEIYLETCDKNPAMKGCPTCDQAPSMPHCGLNQDSWQDLTGLPDGADPSSCKSVGDLDDNWCVQNCGGTPPNCPATLCKCKAPAGSASSKASTKKETSKAEAAPAAKGTAPSPIKAVGQAPSSPNPTAASEAAAQAEPQQQQQQAGNVTEQQQQQQQQAAPQEEQEIERPVDDDEDVEGVGLVHGWTAQDTQQEAQIKEDREQEARCRVGPDGFCHKEGEKVHPTPDSDPNPT